MTDFAIETRQMTRRFGALTAVNCVDLAIPKGSIYGFLGPNGCGKSTAIRMLTGLLKPTTGEVRVLGYSLPRESDALRLRMGYMTQKFSLYQDLTVLENLHFVGQIYGLTKHQACRRISELLTTYNLLPQQHQMAGTMSGGQKQRLALAAATLHKPDVLFLDEPTSAVDPENRREFWERLFDLCDQGTTILVSTHYMDEAERCHALAILENGSMRAEGSPQSLINNMDANVVEVSGSLLRQLKLQLSNNPNILSTAQLGQRLRVLVRRNISDPVAWLQHQLNDPRDISLVRASLEDVFVTCTGDRGAKSG